MKTRIATTRVAVALCAGFAIAAVPTSAAQAKPDVDCQRAGISALRSLGALDDVARSGLPISTAVSLGVTPRAGTDVGSLPDPLPLPVILADHRAGENSLFSYPWCS
jgi:hypothetical protein